MGLIFNIIAVLLIIKGLHNLLNSLKHRADSASLLVGKHEIPFWFFKAGVSIFIIWLGIFVIMV